jgi:regulator of protease activity HflC (stomatin/prohibitin superfamily)
MDIPRQNVITKDNVSISINALIYFQIMDAKSAVYRIQNLPEAIEKLTLTTMRNVIGDMVLDETLSFENASPLNTVQPLKSVVSNPPLIISVVLTSVLLLSSSGFGSGVSFPLQEDKTKPRIINIIDKYFFIRLLS